MSSGGQVPSVHDLAQLRVQPRSVTSGGPGDDLPRHRSGPRGRARPGAPQRLSRLIGSGGESSSCGSKVKSWGWVSDGKWSQYVPICSNRLIMSYYVPWASVKGKGCTEMFCVDNTCPRPLTGENEQETLKTHETATLYVSLQMIVNSRNDAFDF